MFCSRRSGNGDIYSKASSGTGNAELVYGGEANAWLTSLSQDGATGWLTSVNATAGTGADVYRIDLGSREAVAFLQTPSSESDPRISPDGRWLLYVSTESGRREVYVQSLRDDGVRWPISIEGGRHPRWTRDGGEILFQAPDGTLMVVEVTLEPDFSAGIPEVLFDAGDAWGIPRYDVTPDGNRFLVVEDIEADDAESLTLVQELDERAGTVGATGPE